MTLGRHVVQGIAVLAAALTALAPAYAAAPKGPKIEAPGEVTIMSLTNGATIEIDGKVVGSVPMQESLTLLPGTHTVKVYKRGFSEYNETFEVKAADTVELEIDLLPFAGMVKIVTAEPGATVKVDGKVEGATPFDKDIPAGRKVFTISREDFYDEVREIDVRAGEFYDIEVKLRPMPKVVAGGGGPEFYETWWFWTIVGVAAAGGVAAGIATTSGGETVSPRADFALSVP